MEQLAGGGAAADVSAALRALADPSKTAGKARFFQAVPGGYGEGDRFIGVGVPQTRKVARRYATVPLDEAAKLLREGVHEERLAALFILVNKFAKAGEAERGEIIDLYLSATAHVNNWDLVDSSAFQLLGEWLVDRDRTVLAELTRSSRLWDRRIAIMATFTFIRRNDYAWTLRLAEALLHDPHDLIHKAVGWMLREVGNRDRRVELEFLAAHRSAMPRTMLRYAIEHFEPEQRRALLAGRVDGLFRPNLTTLGLSSGASDS